MTMGDPIPTTTATVGALRWVPWCLRYSDPEQPVEATGLALDNWALGPVFMASLFLGPALLQLANAAAGCTNNNLMTGAAETEECDGKVYGFRPSSLLANMAVASGLLVPLTLPLVGAMVDHTPHRHAVGAWSAILLAVVKGVEIGVGPNTWAAITVLQVASGLLYNVHITVTYAYTSELSDQPAVQARYNAFYSMVQYASMLCFLITILVLSGVWQTDDVGTARISQTVTTLTAFVLFPWAWRYTFRPQPATATLQPGEGLVRRGLIKVVESCYRIALHYPSLFWVIVALVFCEAAMSALATIATTFCAHVLGMNAQEIGLLFLVVLVAGLPGSALCQVATERWGPLWAARVTNLLFILVTAGASFQLRDPSHQGVAYVYGAAWGLLMGCLSPVDTTLYIAGLPNTPDRAEFMGIYLWAVSILTWLPPLVFTVLNEAGVSMAWGLLSLDFFCVAALLALCWVRPEEVVGGGAEGGMEMLPTIDDVEEDHDEKKQGDSHSSTGSPVLTVERNPEQSSLTGMGHRHPLGPSRGPTLLNHSGGLLLLLYIIATSMDLSGAWIVTPTRWQGCPTGHGHTQSLDAKWEQRVSRGEKGTLPASRGATELNKGDTARVPSGVGLLPVMQDHLNTYLQMLEQDIDKGGKSWLKPYLEYRLA